ncbi:hypothetical protein B0H63DRAFT_520672 [Podospora didyma]|uniref:Uncharacterized protein n=1 Tax=Podospora didyma TaxID=330526 RepID=A0AAE0NS26_9PEZI|nr:hypothetical protein B0H63DRAFT_520672 [Podospora didyma]
MFSTTLRRLAAQVPKPQLNPEALRPSARLKKVWPPEFSKLSPQEQLRYEKRYKRRLAHLAERPRWNKFVTLAQYFSISFVIVYSILFMDWKNEVQPFDEIREWFWGTLGGIFSTENKWKKREETPEGDRSTR